MLPPHSSHNQDIELPSHMHTVQTKTTKTTTQSKTKNANIEDTLTQKTKSWMKPASLWNRITKPFSQTATRNTNTSLAAKTVSDKNQSSGDAAAPLANPNTNVWGVGNV